MDSVQPAVLGEYVRTLKVASLKELIKLFNERLPYSAPLRLSGNKPDLVLRLLAFIDSAARVPRNYFEMVAVMGPHGLLAWLEDQHKLRRATDQCVTTDQICRYIRTCAERTAAAEHVCAATNSTGSTATTAHACLLYTSPSPRDS